MNSKISFIIPVYNVEKYLSKCIDSVLNQNYKNLEVLLINDGSSDNSPIICDEYADQDDRVKVFHKSNGGPSSARNLGIDSATGEYICFLDSDDFWLPNKLNSMMSQILRSSCDLLIFPMVSFYENQKSYQSFLKQTNFQEGLIGNENLMSILKNDYTFGWCPVCYVIKLKVLNDKKLRFLEGYLCEDVDFVFSLWHVVEKVSYFSDDVYVYRRENDNSITHIASYKFTKDLLFMIKRNLEKFNDLKIKNELKGLLYLNFQDLIGVCLYWYSNYTKIERKMIYNDIKSITYIFKKVDGNMDYSSNKNKIVKLLISVLGINLTGLIWGIKRKLRK